MDADRRRLVLLGLLVFGGWYFAGSGASPEPQPTPGPAPNPADVQQLRSAFGEAGKVDALKLACLCRAVADRLDADTRLPAEQRRLTTSGKLNDFRRMVREDYLGSSLTAKYPPLADYLRQFFTARVGEFDEKLDDAKRATWSLAFRDLAAAAEEASH